MLGQLIKNPHHACVGEIIEAWCFRVLPRRIRSKTHVECPDLFDFSFDGNVSKLKKSLLIRNATKRSPKREKNKNNYELCVKIKLLQYVLEAVESDVSRHDLEQILKWLKCKNCATLTHEHTHIRGIPKNIEISKRLLYEI